MKRKQPEVYVNKIAKKFKNNNIIFYSAIKPKKDIESYEEEAVKRFYNEDDMDINLKIKEMFNSPNYIYKMGAWIYTKDGRSMKKEIIGEIDNKLITLDEEYIAIEDIKRIEY